MNINDVPQLRSLEGLRRMCEADIRALDAAPASDEVARLRTEIDLLRADVAYDLDCSREELGLSQGSENDRLKAPMPSGVIASAEDSLQRFSAEYRELRAHKARLLSEEPEDAVEE